MDTKILEHIGLTKNESIVYLTLIKEAISELEKIREKKTKEIKAVTYTGLRGIKTATEEALESMKNKEEILAMGVTEKKDKRFNEFWINWTEKRIKKKIIAKHIFSESGDYFNKFRKMKYTETKNLEGLTPVT